ncbi:hypothetical protein PAPHI01_2147 [Pancytospora philotis]|nr:hypothetical protein PAPHI01_2147 [Pancytospora philotis]
MEDALDRLVSVLDSGNPKQTAAALDEVIEAANDLPNEELAQHFIDPIVKKLLARLPTKGTLERVGDLLFLVRDPRNFHAELTAMAEDGAVALPALQLIFHIRQDFDFPYEEFHARLCGLIDAQTVQSEDFLLFILRCLEDRSTELPVVTDFLRKLSSVALQTSSAACLQVVYTILVLMRMHPAAFRAATSLSELGILTSSFASIKSIVQRILIEAEHPAERPRAVFLQNFAFPEF